MPYIFLGKILSGRYILGERSVIISKLNICVDTSIGFLFGRLVPLGSVEFLIVAMISYNTVVNAVVRAVVN